MDGSEENAPSVYHSAGCSDDLIYDKQDQH